MPPLLELEKAARDIVPTEEFRKEFGHILRDFVGRPTPLYRCPTLSRDLGFNLWLKREDLAHTGAHKINNTLGQALLAKHMGKTRLIAETGAGQHGVATATAAAMTGLSCTVYMGAVDVRRQAHNVRRMELLGAKVVAVENGTRTLKDAINVALRAWIAELEDTHYCVGSVVGPHPFPWLVREFQQVIGLEAREEFMTRNMGRLPDALVACVGGGSNAIGLFHPFLDDPEVALYGVEAGGEGVATGHHAAPLAAGRPGVLHGNRTYLMENDEGQIMATHSISAGLDYPGVGPEHAWLKDSGRAAYVAVNDDAALAAFHHLTRTEGIIPALETAHALAYADGLARELGPGRSLVINLSGRGDKDIQTVAELEGKSP
jgi:tryptophan synthase beta chain